MQSTNNRNEGNHVISAVLAIGTAFFTIVAVFMLILIIEFGRILSNAGYVLVESIAILVLATTPCFFICKRNPDSVWYVSVIVNIAVLIICGFLVTGTWNLAAKIILPIISISLATYLSILGAKKGRK